MIVSLLVEEHHLLLRSFDKMAIDFSWRVVDGFFNQESIDPTLWNVALFLHCIGNSSLHAFLPNPRLQITRQDDCIWNSIKWIHSRESSASSPPDFFLTPYLPEPFIFHSVLTYLVQTLSYVTLRRPDDNVMIIKWLVSKLIDLTPDERNAVCAVIQRMLLDAPQLSYRNYAIPLSRHIFNYLLMPGHETIVEFIYAIQATLFRVLQRDSPTFFHSTIATILRWYVENPYSLVYNHSPA